MSIKPTLLLVDDAPSNLHVLLSAFEDDYEILIATNGHKALDIAQGELKPNLILLDIMMPGMDGYQTITALKNNPATKHIPVIFLSALSETESQEYGFALGAVDYITKPFEISLLKQRVKSHLNIHEQLHDLDNQVLDLREKLEDIDIHSLHEESSNFSQLFLNSRDAVLITNHAQEILRVNPAFSDITGYSEQEVLGKTPKILKSGRHNATFYQKLYQQLDEKGIWRGEIYNKRKNGEIYLESLNIFKVDSHVNKDEFYYLAIFSEVTHLSRALEAKNKLTWYDPFTQLPNRLLYLERLEQMHSLIERKPLFTTALLIDISNFKQVNLQRDVTYGDKVLIDIIYEIQQNLPKETTFARLNGDVFALLIGHFSDTKEEAAHQGLLLAQTLTKLVKEYSLSTENDIFHLRCRVAITLLGNGPNMSPNAAETIRQLESVRFHLKKLDTESILIYNQTINDLVKQKFELEQSLQIAIETNQLRMFLQPQYDLNHNLVGSEALVRWQHPDRGLIPPDKFIPTAEQSDLILSLDYWMLKQALQLIKEHQDNPNFPSISVNLSAKQFIHDSRIDNIVWLIENSDINPKKLVLEITEGIFIENSKSTFSRVNRLNQLGIEISLDDFGTGYSNLKYLKTLPIQELKIDKSFTDDFLSDAISANLVRIMIDLSNTFNMRTIIEGVEDQAQLNALANYPNIRIQGYVFSKPLPMSEWLKLI